MNQDNRTADAPVNEPSKVRVHENNSALVAKEKHDKFMSQAPVIVLGATNRPTDLDKAFLRRMPVQIQTHMPDLSARVAIFRAQLHKDLVAEDVDLSELAAATNNFSGSDIRELIRVAKQQRAKNLIRSAARESLIMLTDDGVEGVKAPASKAITKEHFSFALNKAVHTGTSY